MERYKSLGIKPSIFGDPLGNRGDYSKGIYYSGRRKYLYEESSNLPPMEPPREMMTNKQKRKSSMATTKGVPIIQRLDFKRAPETNEIRTGSKKAETQKKKNILVITTAPTTKEDWNLQQQAGCSFWVHNGSGEIRTECPFSTSFPVPDSRASTPGNKSLFSVPSPVLRTKSAETLRMSSSPRYGGSPYRTNSNAANNSPISQLQQSDEIILLDTGDDDMFIADDRENTQYFPFSQSGSSTLDEVEGTGALVYENTEYLELLMALDSSLKSQSNKGKKS